MLLQQRTSDSNNSSSCLQHSSQKQNRQASFGHTVKALPLVKHILVLHIYYTVLYHILHYTCSRHTLLTIHRKISVTLQAIEAGQGSKDDWAEFKYRHRQAEQDSHLLYSVLQQAEQFHQVCCCLFDME